MPPEPSHMALETAQTGAVLARQLAANQSVVRALAGRLRRENPRFIVTIARGSSDHAALYIKYLAEILLGKPCASLGPSLASLYQAPLDLRGVLALTLSQSGRSPDILALQAAAKRAGAVDAALVNDPQSPAALAAEVLLPLHAGAEASVAATKSMLAACFAGAALLAEWRGDDALRAGLAALPALLAAQTAPAAGELVAWLASATSAFVIGRGPTYAMAMEAALKLKETCGIHAETFSAAEVLHGPAGIVTSGFPVIAFLPPENGRAETLATLERLEAMGARILAVDCAPLPGVPTLVAAAAGHALATPLSLLHRFYSLAEACARARGRDPDRPPHLRKVTQTV